MREIAAKSHGKVSLHALDVTNDAAIAALAHALASEPIDILINNAGIKGDLHSMEPAGSEAWEAVLRTNTIAPFRMAWTFRPHLERGARRLIVNISSGRGSHTRHRGDGIAYCASKAAVDNLTRSLARALAPRIRVVSVSPGVVDTKFIRGLDKSWRDAQASRTPLGRLGAPDDVADAVLACATALRFTTGAIIPSDGGRPLG